MSAFVIPMLMLGMGFFMGIVVYDARCGDERITRLEREVQRLKKRMEVME